MSFNDGLMCYLNSSAIVAVDYSSDSRLLHIWFPSKDEPYTFYGVPERIYLGLVNAASPGTYYNNYIRGNYSA